MYAVSQRVSTREMGGGEFGMSKRTANDRLENVAARTINHGMEALLRGVAIALLCGALATGASSAWASEDVKGSDCVKRADGASPDRDAECATPPVSAGKNFEDWQFELAPYGWFVFVPGTINFFDQSAPIDLQFDQIWKHLHMALFLDADVRKGDFGFYSDLFWAKLWSRDEERVLSLKTDLNIAIFDFGFYYEAVKLNLGSGPSAPKLRLQPFFGGRYFYNAYEIKVRPVELDLGPLTPTVNTAAPILGLRGFIDISERWTSASWATEAASAWVI
jgi:hypothetical protein